MTNGEANKINIAIYRDKNNRLVEHTFNADTSYEAYDYCKNNIDAKDIYCLHPLSGEAWLIGDSEKANKIGEEYYKKHGVKPIF